MVAHVQSSPRYLPPRWRKFSNNLLDLSFIDVESPVAETATNSSGSFFGYGQGKLMKTVGFFGLVFNFFCNQIYPMGTSVMCYNQGKEFVKLW